MIKEQEKINKVLYFDLINKLVIYTNENEY